MRNGNWKKLCVIFVAFFAIVIFCSCSCSCSEPPESEIRVSSLVLSTDAGKGLNVRKNQTFKISYTTTPTNAEVPGVYVSSSNSLCVMVNTSELDEFHGEAEFLAVGVGKATITFMSKDNGISKTCEVTVFEPTVLSAPTNIRYDGSKLVWDEVAKDLNGSDRLSEERYKLSITSDGSTKTFTLEDNQFYSSSLFTFEKEKHYAVSVQALGDDIRNSNSQVSKMYQFYILGTPKYTTTNGNVRWYFSQTESSNNNPNFYKVTYNEAGDYVLVSNTEGLSANNHFDFSDNLKDINDFFVSIQAIKLPATTTEADVKAIIDDAIENEDVVHGLVNDIDYIASEESNGFSLHRTVAIQNVRLENDNLGNLTLNNLDFENAYQSTVLKFEGEGDYYLGKIKYALEFRNNKRNTSKTIILAPGVTEYELGEDFITDIVSELGQNSVGQAGSMAYDLTDYTVKIYPMHSTNDDVASIIIGPTSSTYTFTYFRADATMLDIKIDATNAELTFKNPLHNSMEYFETFQFIFVNPETKDYKMVEPVSDKIDLKEALQGLQGSYQIWINLKGVVSESYILGAINRLGIKFVGDGGEPEVIETISAPSGLRLLSNGEIVWNRVDGAKEYRVELKINDATTYYATIEDGENGNKYSLHTLLEEWESSYNDLSINKSYEIRVVSIAEKEGVIDSASDALVFQKLNQVQNVKYENGYLYWDELGGVSKYIISINGGTEVEVSKSETTKNIYADTRLYSAIYHDATIENTISIWAVGAENEGTTDSMPVSIKVSKSKTPNLTKISNGRLYWENAGIEGDAYKVQVFKQGVLLPILEETTTNNYFDLSVVENTSTLYTSVIRYSETTFESEKSFNFYFRILAEPEFKVIQRGENFYIAWNIVEGAESYQIKGLPEGQKTISKDETQIYNSETQRFEYKLENLDSVKKYNISIIAQVKAEYLREATSSVLPALVASKEKAIAVAKLPKVSYVVEETSVSWNFTNWALYEEYLTRSSEFKYDLVITNGLGEKVVDSQNLSTNQRTYDFEAVKADTYTVAIKLKGVIESENSSDYIVYSDISTIEITKLKTVELGIEDGKLVFDRTVEGEKSTNASHRCDYYLIFADERKLTADEYQIEENIENGKMIVTLNSIMASETSYSIIVRRTKTLSGDLNFVDSSESTKLKAKNINISSFEKKGNNFEFVPAVLDNGEDVAHSYIITGSHTTNSGYSYYKVIEGGDEQYFEDGKYIVPNVSLSAGAGKYIFKIQVVGQEIVTDDTKVAYLGDEEGRTISVIVLNNPSDSQAIIEDGTIKLAIYNGVSKDELDIPNEVVITFEKYNETLLKYETYGEPISLEYKGLEFKEDKYELDIPEDYLEAGEYKIYVQFIGDENLLVSSARIQGNKGGTVAKVVSTNIFVKDGELCWNEVSDASYRLFIEGEEDYIEIKPSDESIKIDNNIVTLNTKEWPAGRRVVKIQVVKDGSLPSDETEEFEVFKLNAMEIEANSDNGVKILTWEQVLEGATNQIIYLDDEVLDDTLGISNNSWVITTNQEVGSHSFSMVSKGSVDTRHDDGNVGYLTSDPSNTVAINFIESTVKVTLENGIAKWAEDKGILTYQVSLYKLAGYPEIKELVSQRTTTTTNKTEFDINSFGVGSGQFVLEVVVTSIDPLSEIMTSTHEEIETNYFKLIKIDEIAGSSIYSNIRVENGMFAFDITDEYLEKYKNILKSINSEVEVYDDISLESIVAILEESEEATADMKEILYSLTNFNAKLNGRNLTALVPSEYKVNTEAVEGEEGEEEKTVITHITLYYEITLKSNEYEIEFAPIGNSCASDSEVVVGVLNGNYTNKIVAIKPDKPTCPVLMGSGNSIDKGILIWAAPAGYDGKYIVEFKEVATGKILEKEVTVVDRLTGTTAWEAKVQDGKIQLNLNTAVAMGELTQGIEYLISIYTAGTENSNNIASDETKYLTGVKNSLAKPFISLKSPLTFRADDGEIYWSTVASAIGYELYIYGYNADTREYDVVIDEYQAMPFENNENRFSLMDNEDLPAGRYKVGIKAKGDGNYQIDSPITYSYFVKLGTVQVYVKNGYFAFNELSYNEIDDEGLQTGVIKQLKTYKIRVVERNSSIEVPEYAWLSESSLIKNGSTYYYELPDELRENLSDYKLEVYAMGDSGNLLSGDTSSSLFFNKSEIPTGFEIDKDGLISWDDLDGDYFYAVYVRPTAGSAVRVDFEGLDYTVQNSFDINAYVSELNKYGEYEIFVKSLKNNPTEINNQKPTNTELISSKSEIIKLYIVAPPTISLQNGDIDWQSDSFETIKEEITTSYLIIKGKILIGGVLSTEEKTIKVKCLETEPYFINGEYSAVFKEENNEAYYEIDLVKPVTTNTKVSLAGGEQYSIQVHYIGYIGEVSEGETYLCSSKSSTAVSAVTCLQTPTKPVGVDNRNETSSFDYSNYIKWQKVSNAKGYEVAVYSMDSSDKRTFYERFNTISNSELFEETSSYAYFALDLIIEEFAIGANSNNKISVQVKAIGSTWAGYGADKFISSNYSEFIDIEYPKAVSNLKYNGAGLISWTNNANGTVVIEVEYVVNTDIYNAGLCEGFTTYQNFVNYDEIVNRTTTGVTTIVAVDTIKIPSVVEGDDGVYQLKYLTSEIRNIKVWVESTNFISMEQKLSSVGDNPDLSSTTKVFNLFNGGDGSSKAPYRIKNEANFKNIRHYLDSQFEIIDNISLTSAIAPMGSKSQTVGTAYEGSVKAFTGSIKGNLQGGSITISNVQLIADEETDASAYFFGIFYELSDTAKISNVNVVFANGETKKLTATNKVSYIGGLVANKNYGTIENVSASGNIYVEGAEGTNGISNIIYLSGIATNNYGTIGGTGSVSSINLVVVSKTVSYIGGVSYYNYGEILNHGISSNLLEASDIGGIAFNNAGTISNSFVRANITVNGGGYSNISVRVAGGIAGNVGTANGATASCKIEKSYSIIKVSVKNIVNCYIGGLVGMMKSGSLHNVYTEQTGSATGATVGKVYGSYNGGSGSAICYHASNLGTNVAGNGSGMGNESSKTGASAALNELNSNGEAFKQSGTSLKMLWES